MHSAPAWRPEGAAPNRVIYDRVAVASTRQGDMGSNYFASVLVVLRLFTATIYGITHLVEYKDPEGRHALPLFLAHRIVEWLPRLGEFIQIG